MRDYVTRNRTEKYSLECSVLRVFKATLGYTEKKVSGKSGKKLKGTQLFLPFQWKISGSENGTSKWAVLFFRRTELMFQAEIGVIKPIFDISFRLSRRFIIFF